MNLNRQAALRRVSRVAEQLRNDRDAYRYRLGSPRLLNVQGDFERLPETIKHNLARSRQLADRPLKFQPAGSQQGWVETLYSPTADGTQILNSVTEAIMIPDFTLPANYMQQGRTLKYTLFFDNSTVITTPGTITLKLRWGGVAGTTLATSGAYAPDPTAASTTVSGYVEWFVVARAAPAASASSYTMGRCWFSDFDDASATTIIGNLNMHVIPASAPAAVNIATNAANALSPTMTFSVSTATTQSTTHIAILESLN